MCGAGGLGALAVSQAENSQFEDRYVFKTASPGGQTGIQGQVLNKINLA